MYRAFQWESLKYRADWFRTHIQDSPADPSILTLLWDWDLCHQSFYEHNYSIHMCILFVSTKVQYDGKINTRCKSIAKTDLLWGFSATYFLWHVVNPKVVMVGHAQWDIKTEISIWCEDKFSRFRAWPFWNCKDCSRYTLILWRYPWYYPLHCNHVHHPIMNW